MSPLPIVGFRLWIANSDRLELRSLTDDNPWSPCVAQTAHKLPTEGYDWESPGIHGWYRLEYRTDFGHDLRNSYSGWFSIERIYRALFNRSHEHWVAGAIIGWGRTVLHEFGFRSEHAQLIALHYRPGERDLKRLELDRGSGGAGPPQPLRQIAAKYNVPLCETPNDLYGVATEYGRLVRGEDLVAQ